MKTKKENESITSYLQTRDMAAGYDKKLVVDGVEISVNKGEIVTLIGPNGSGKSTVLRSIIGQLKLLRGAVYLDDTGIDRIKREVLARSVSILMTDRVKTELMTCFDVVATARYPYTGSLGLLTDDDRRIIKEALLTVNGADLADLDFNSLSDGQRQRVLLARCIAQEPDLIVLDEPTSFLDIKYKIELLKILKDLAVKRGTAIVMSMHEIDFARHISDRVVCIGSKGIDRIGRPEEVLTPDYLCKLFDISEESYKDFFDEGRQVSSAYVSRNGKLLRKGITTGTCATAAAYGAARLLLAGEELKSVTLKLPSGEKAEVDIMSDPDKYDKEDGAVGFYVIKDSGDDPDVTNGAKICVSAEKVDIKYEAMTDHTGKAFTDQAYPGIFLAGGEGVGTVTEEGLEQPVGYPAINKVPRRMIFEAVDSVRNEAGYEGGILIRVSVKDGEKIADKTFNSRLGIEGGISILGTSGILEPMSDRAIVDTIEVQIRQQAARGKKSLLVTPGLYGQNYVKNELGLSLEDAIKCSNFIGDTIDIAASYDFEEILLVGNLGKLIKLASGIMNTHSRVADGRMDIMCTHLALCGGTTDMVKEMYTCINTDSALDRLKEWGLFDQVIGSILNAVRERIMGRAPASLKVSVKVFSEKYGYLGEA